MKRFVLFASTLAAIVGCEPDSGVRDAAACGDEGCGCEIMLQAQVPTTGVGESLVVRGTAVHARERTIRAIYVGARRAASDTLNFGTWSVTLDAEDLRALATVENLADGGVTTRLRAPIVAIDFAGVQCRSEIDQTLQTSAE